MQKTKLILSLAMVFIITLLFGIISALQISDEAEADTATSYYYDQLTSTEAKSIYKALSDMKEKDAFKTGTETWDLVEKGYLSNKEYDQTTLTAAFGMGRDAFMLDNADLFYLDFDKLSLRMLTDGSNYKITLGVGREDTYLADGFTSSTVGAAISDFETKVDEIAKAAAKKTSLTDKILYVYETVMDGAVYALEFDAGDDADYVRCAYGVLVKGKGVCQSFSQAVKTILDKMGITNVLVQGMYIDDEEGEKSHMWNYVFMDDNRWYILDATMDNAWRDAGTEDALIYFLMNGTNAAGLYAPDGIISTSGFEFEYPALSMADYEAPSTKFTFETVTTENGSVEYQQISYNGMGIRAAAEQGYYILVSFNVNTETNWYYLLSQIYFALANSGGNIDDYDFETCFSGLTLGNADYILAVTTDEPSSDLTTGFAVSYTGSNIFDKSNAILDDSDDRAPYALYVSPDCLRFYIGSSYNVTITFSDDLKLANSTESVTISYSVPETVTLSSPDTLITNVTWSESTPSQVSFTFTPDKNYSADRCNYTFTVNNLVGETSGKAPTTVILTALYKPSFSCPMDPLSYCTAVASVPTLISDGDLSTSGWTYTDENGSEQTVSSSSLGAKISLVATEYTDEANEECVDAINAYNEANGDDTTILKSATYDLSLNLCDVQMKYLNGTKVMIMVPYPEGYTATSGASFKAYHFKSATEVEEIDCYCTEYGIILFCSSFSAYTIAAVESSTTDVKTVLINTEGKGSASTDNLVKVENGGTLSVKLTANDNYCIDSITINGETFSLNGATEYEIVKGYDELSGNTTIIVKFASSSVVKGELDSGYSLSSAQVIKTGNSDVIAMIVIIAAIVVLCIILAVVLTIILKNKFKKRR